MILNLVLLPLLLNVLGKTRFGIWQTILSFIGYVSLLNFGMGNGLRNTIAKAYASKNFNEIGNLTGQTIARISKIVLLFSVILLPLYYYYFNAEILFKDAGKLSTEIRSSILIYLIFFLLNIVFSLASSISFGTNKSYIPGFVNFLYLLSVFIIISILRYYIEINLVYISIIFGLLQIIFNALYLIIVINKLNLTITFNKIYDLKETNSLSYKFFIVQLLSILFLTIDNIIISNLLGPDKTAEYSIISKIYFTVISFYSILLISFWNGVTIAHTEKNIVWIKKNIKILFYLSIGVLILGLVISLLNKFIISIWFGKSNSLHLYYFTFVLFSLYSFLHCINAILINFQNGIGAVKTQIISTTIMLLTFILMVYAIDINKYGYDAVVVIKCIAVILGLIINSMSLKKLL